MCVPLLAQTLGFSDGEREALFDVVRAILHLGNVDFEEVCPSHHQPRAVLSALLCDGVACLFRVLR